jgi:micrococcal nuclease
MFSCLAAFGGGGGQGVATISRRGKDLVTRKFFVLMLVVSLVLIGCESPNSPTETPEQQRGTEKAAKDERLADEKEAKPKGSGASTQDGQLGPEPKQQRASSEESGPPSTNAAPQDVLASQYRHINSADYGSAYDLFDERSQRLVSLEQYIAFFTSVAPYKVTGYSFPSVQVQGDTASVVVDLAVSSAAGEEELQVTQRLVRSDGGWRVVMRDEQVAIFTDAGSSSTSASASASPAPAGTGGNNDATVTVSRVVDGDTIEISPAVNGIEEVRLIGVDTTETKDPSEGVEPYGPEASRFATRELSGERVELEFDVERTDQYGRLLAYVYLSNAGGVMFNEELVEEGYAQAYPYPPNTKYESTFAEAQEEARAGRFGIWGLSLEQQCELANHGNGIGEGSVGCGAVSSETASATATTTATATATAGPAGGGAPPLPADEDYDCEHFATQARAQAVLDQTYPADPHQLDGSPEDGVACESLP